MDKRSKGTLSGLSFWYALQIVFIVLKLIGKISWRWVIVLLPLEIEAAICIISLIILFAVAWKDK